MTIAASLAWTGEPAARAWRAPALAGNPLGYHRSLPGYRPTALTELPELAAELGVGRLFVKDESARLGLPAFKILGASWAIERALAGRDRPPATLVAATDGNHGRAVARVAAQRRLGARILIPDGVHPAAVAAIATEGADVVRVGGSYDDAVRAAKNAAENPADNAAQAAVGDPAGGAALLIQDMAWPGYTEIPAWIVEGYTTMFAEIDDQLAAAGAGGPGLVVVPAGVGSLAQAAIAYYRRPGIAGPPALLCAEPEQAACVQHSLRAGKLTAVETTETIMAGLNCGTPSSAAWPYLSSGLDAAVAVTDAEAGQAVADLARLGVPAGPCGAAPLAAARRALAGRTGPAGVSPAGIGPAGFSPVGPGPAGVSPAGTGPAGFSPAGTGPAGVSRAAPAAPAVTADAAADLRRHLGITGATTIVLLSTEGAAANPARPAADGP